MIQIYVKPAKGRIVRHESTHMVLLPGGDWWPDNAATRRLIRNGDIVEATAPGAVLPEPEREDVAPVLTVDPSIKILSMIDAARAKLREDDVSADVHSAEARTVQTASKKSRKQRA